MTTQKIINHIEKNNSVDYFILDSKIFHLGDAAWFLSYVPAYKGKYNIKFGIIVDEKLDGICRLFSTVLDEIIVVHRGMIQELLEYVKTGVALPNLKGTICYDDLLDAELRKKGMNIIEYGLNLNKHSKQIEKIQIPDETIKKGKEIVDDLIIDKNVVVIMPYAKSVTELPLFFWERLVNNYKKDGYKVYTNVYGDERIINGTEGISLSVDLMAYVCTYVYKVISLQSGFSDLLKNYGFNVDLTILLYKRLPVDMTYYKAIYNRDELKISDSIRFFGINKEELGEASNYIFKRLEK